MVEDRITDGKRIAQLLASELTGLETAPLHRIGVVDSTPDVEPTPDGVEAYGVAVDGDRFGTVTVFPDHVRVALEGSLPATVESGDGVAVSTDGTLVTVRIEYGAAVKRAVDLVVAVASA